MILPRKTIILSPDQQSVFVPFTLLDDNIAELTETFDVFLSVPEGRGLYTLGIPATATVSILDDEGLSV